MLIVFILFIAGLYFVAVGSKKWRDAQDLQQELSFRFSQLEEYEIELDSRKKNIVELETKTSNLVSIVSNLSEEQKKLVTEIEGKYDPSLLAVYPSIIIPNIEETTSSEIKNQLSLLKLKEKELVLDGAILFQKYLTKKESSTLKKKMLLPLDSEITGLLNKLSLSNIDSTREKIIKVFDKINRLYASENVKFTKKYLALKLEVLELNYSYIVKKNDEKEQQKAIKEQMIEEEKVRREIDREKKRIDKEERQFNSEITKLLGYIQKVTSEVEKQLYIDKIKELELKLKELERVKENVLERELNTRAGYVYIISNIGSFGEHIYKIGMTRRLEPMDRIKELGSASVPFEFDVHAMIFSEDAPKLENELHKHFKAQEVNKVNSRKEFFKVNLSEIEKVVLEKYNGTVSFTKTALAEQYRRSLELD